MKNERCAVAFLRAAIAYEPGGESRAGDDRQRVLLQILCFRKACKRLGLKHVRTRPYHAEDQRQGADASSRLACASGPTPAPTTPQPIVPPSCQDGFTATIGTGLTATYNLKHQSADST
jgi:hypothetical protein